MKKSSKILGSIALSAALVMGTAVPAFADAPDSASDEIRMVGELDNAIEQGSFSAQMRNGASALVQENGTASGASTLVQVGTYTSQINVTIPVSLPLYFDTAGGTGLAPTNGEYKIVNQSTADITVQSAEYKIKENKAGEWKFGTGAYPANGIDRIKNKSGNTGDIFVSIAPAKACDKSVDPSGFEADTGKTALQMKSDTTEPGTGDTQSGLNWTITGGSELGFAITPSSTQLSRALTTFEPVATITYTVGVGTTATNPSTTPGAPKNISEAVGNTVKASDVAALLGNNITWYTKESTKDAPTELTGLNVADDYVMIANVFSVTTDTFTSTTTWNNVSSNTTVTGDALKTMTYAVCAEKVDAPAAPAAPTGE